MTCRIFEPDIPPSEFGAHGRGKWGVAKGGTMAKIIGWPSVFPGRPKLDGYLV